MSADDDFEELGRRFQARKERISKFFLPLAKDDTEAESVFEAICKFNDRPVPPLEERLRRVAYTHNGEYYVTEVGQPIDPYYCEEGPVFAILPGNPLLICTGERGVVRGSPILVGHDSVLKARYFGDSEER
jgi:hypothetical protein